MCTCVHVRACVHRICCPQNKCTFKLLTFNVWPFVLFEISLWLVFLLLLDDKTWIVLYMWLNIFKFFTNFSNKTNGQTLGTDIHSCTYFGAEVVVLSTAAASCRSTWRRKELRRNTGQHMNISVFCLKTNSIRMRREERKHPTREVHVPCVSAAPAAVTLSRSFFPPSVFIRRHCSVYALAQEYNYSLLSHVFCCSFTAAAAAAACKHWIA